MTTTPNSADDVWPVPKGHKRQWCHCERHDNYAYYDYVPYSLSSPISIMPCGCNIKDDCVKKVDGLSSRQPDLVEELQASMMREVIARAIFATRYRTPDYSWETYPAGRQLCLMEAQAALDAISEAGFVIVPKEPSEAMLRAAEFRFDRSLTESTAPEVIYRAMIEASQLAPHNKSEPTQD